MLQRRKKDASRARQKRGRSTQDAQLVNTKLMPTQVASALVRRPELVAVLDRALETKKVVLLVAPLGSGKTGLLSEWYSRTKSRRSVAWLSLEELDNAPQRFFSYLAGAIHTVVESFDAHVPCPPRDGMSLPSDLVAATLLESMARIEQDFVVVLDDFQHVTDPAIARAFAHVLHHSPPQTRWVIAARQTPALDLGKLILQDQLAELGTRELNFEAREINGLSRALHGMIMAPADAEHIRDRTGGWVAGVKLALLSSGGQPTRESLDQFSGSHPEVARYLADAVLRDLPQNVREFLLVSSVVDRMTGDLCGALLDAADGQALLEYVEKSQLFVQPLDRYRHWYRYHPLFLDFLRDRLRREYPERLSRLHRLASGWFAERQMIEEALAHAFLSGERAWCVELMAGCVREWVREGEIASALRWLPRLSHEEILSSEELWAHCALILVLARRFGEAAALLGAVEKSRADASSSAQFRLKTLRLMLLSLVGEVDVQTIDFDGLQKSDSDVFFTATLLNIQAFSLCRRYQFDLGRRTAMRARDQLYKINSLYNLSYSEAIIRMADRAQGNLKAALESCEHMCAVAGRRGPAWANAAQALAYARYEQNRLEEAEALCQEVLPLLSLASTPDQLLRAYITLARIKSIQHRETEAFRLLDHLHQIIETSAFPRAFAQVCCEKMRLCLLLGDSERANAVAAEFALPELAARGEWERAREYDEGWERLGFSYAALQMQAQRYDESRSILELLRDSAVSVGYAFRQVPLEGALAVCHWRAGARKAAFETLHRCFALAQRISVGRSLFDEVPDLAAVAGEAVRMGELRYLLPLKHLREFEAAPRGATHTAAEARSRIALVEPLTEREINMLKLVAEGLSNKEISERSSISICTTKWHLRNAFVKLDVSTRTGAIARARALQLIV